MRYVIDKNCLPARLPIADTVLLWLLLDKLEIDGWASGMIWTIWTLLWIGTIMLIKNQRAKPLPGFGE